MSGGDTSTRIAGTGDARGHRDSVRRVLALVGGRAQPHVFLRVRSDLALDLGHLHPGRDLDVAALGALERQRPLVEPK